MLEESLCKLETPVMINWYHSIYFVYFLVNFNGFMTFCKKKNKKKYKKWDPIASGLTS